MAENSGFFGDYYRYHHRHRDDQPTPEMAATVAQAVANIAARREAMLANVDPETERAFEELVHPTSAGPADNGAWKVRDQAKAAVDAEVAQLGQIDPIDWPAFWARTSVSDAAEWLLEPLIPRGRQVAIFSFPKAGKSLLVLEGALALATGRPSLEQPAQPPMEVVYIDQEMTEDDLRERLEDFGYGPEDDLSHLHYYQLCSLPPLDTEAGADALMALVELHRAVLVIIDTMARVVQGDENDADTYRDFYRHTGRRLKDSGVTLVRLDHAGHDPAHQRGSSAKADDVDVVFRLTLEGDVVTLKRTHTRIPWVAEQIRLRRAEEPLSHQVLDSVSWPAGTAALADTLDELDVLLDATVKTAKATLRAHGQGRRTDLVSAALKWRRRGRGTPRGTPKTDRSGTPGGTPGNEGEKPIEQRGTESGNVGEREVGVLGNVGVPRKGNAPLPAEPALPTSAPRVPEEEIPF